MSQPWEDYQGTQTDTLPWEDYQATPSPGPEPSAVSSNTGYLHAPLEAGRELISGMFPEGPWSYFQSIYPPAAMAKQSVDLGIGLAQGDVSGIPLVGRIRDIIEADKTPALSKERYLAAMKTLLDLGMLGGAEHGGGGGAGIDASRAGSPAAEMPGPGGFSIPASEGPVPLPETPIPPSFQPVQPGEPMPYGPEYQAWEQARYGGPAMPDLGMWPLSSAGQGQPAPGSLEALAAAIREQPPPPTLAERITQPQVERPGAPAPEIPEIPQIPLASAQPPAPVPEAPPPPPIGTPLNGVPLVGAAGQTAADVAATQAVPQEANPPVLRAGEQGTGDLFQGEDQPFNLAGQVDPNLKTAAEETAAHAAAKAKAQADADFEKNQLQLLGAEMTPEEESAMRREYEQDSLAALEAHLSRGGDELVDVLKQHGLPLISDATQWKGELQNLREMFGSIGSKTGRRGFGNLVTGTGEKLGYREIFQKGAGSPDLLAEILKEKGFNVENFNDAYNLIAERLRTGGKVYGDEARAAEAEAQSFGRGRIERAGEAGGIPLPFKGRVMDPGAVKGSGRYKDVYQINKEAGDKINNLASSRESAELRATIQTRKVFGNLTPREQDALGQYLVSERLKTVNPDHPQILSPIQTAGIIRQPRIARALNRYKAEVKPEIEMLRKKAGLTSQAAAGKGAEFISLIPATDEMLPSVATPVGTVPLRFRSKTTRFARRAEGMAARYETDLPELLSASYREVTQKARLRDFHEHLERNGLASRDAVDEIRGRPAVPVAIGRAAAGELSSALPDVTFMPAQIADALRDVMETPPAISHPALKAVKAAQRAITGAALTANPAELVNHMRRQLDIVAAQPAANAPLGVRLTEALVPYFGPRLGVAVRTLTENMSTPANQAVLQDIFDAGGGSHRAFQEYQAKRIPGLGRLQHATQQMLFGIPEGRGVKGWDLRMRVQLEKIRRSVEGNTDPQRIREFANQIGQYTSKPDKLIEVARTVNPYAATTLPMRATELKQLFGSSGLKAQSAGQALALRGETLLRGVGGTIIALTTANYMLSGKYPWQNDKGHEFDLNTGMQDAKGKTVYVKLRAIAPTLSRPINTLSIPDLLRERGAEKPDYVAAGAIGPANQALSLIGGPLQNTALAAATGYAPYFTRIPGRPPGLYDVAKGGPSEQRGINNLAAAIQGINPLGRGFEKPESPLPRPLQYIERPIPGVEPLGRIFTRSYEKAEAKPQTIGQKIRAQHAAATRKRIKELKGY